MNKIILVILSFIIGVSTGFIGMIYMAESNFNELRDKHLGYKQRQCKEDFKCEMRMK